MCRTVGLDDHLDSSFTQGAHQVAQKCTIRVRGAGHVIALAEPSERLALIDGALSAIDDRSTSKRSDGFASRDARRRMALVRGGCLLSQRGLRARVVLRAASRQSECPGAAGCEPAFLLPAVDGPWSIAEANCAIALPLRVAP